MNTKRECLKTKQKYYPEPMAIIVSHFAIFFLTCWAAEPIGSFLGAIQVCDIIIILAALHIQ